jgi:hypothetical protein
MGHTGLERRYAWRDQAAVQVLQALALASEHCDLAQTVCCRTGSLGCRRAGGNPEQARLAWQRVALPIVSALHFEKAAARRQSGQSALQSVLARRPSDQSGAGEEAPAPSTPHHVPGACTWHRGAGREPGP